MCSLDSCHPFPHLVKGRIRSIGSIGKITKAMKMVAASKLRTAQDQLEIARTFAQGVSAAWPEPAAGTIPKGDGNTLHVIMTSDRGLCGGVNAQVIRSIRPNLRKTIGSKTKLVLIGDKGRTTLEREFGKYFTAAFTEVGRVKRLTFRQVALCADGIINQDFESGDLTFNRFVSTSTSEPTTVPLYPYSVMLANTDIETKYDAEGEDDVYQNFWEYRTAVRLYHQSSEAYASEVAARMQAMSSSSKNAAEMLAAISLQYNRQRQAKITSELIEIISGAAAAEDLTK